MLASALSTETWLLDACSALNLAASGHLEAILRTPLDGMVRRFMMAQMVVAEAATLRRGGSGDDAEVREPYDWNVHRDSGLLLHTDLVGDEELNRFVLLAGTTSLDDGEAMCLALAGHRGWGVVTDDTMVPRLCGAVPVVTTPDLVRNWVQVMGVDAATLATALRQIQQRARFEPPRSHPLRAWWLQARANS